MLISWSHPGLFSTSQLLSTGLQVCWLWRPRPRTVLIPNDRAPGSVRYRRLIPRSEVFNPEQMPPRAQEMSFGRHAPLCKSVLKHTMYATQPSFEHEIDESVIYSMFPDCGAPGKPYLTYWTSVDVKPCALSEPLGPLLAVSRNRTKCAI